MMNVDQQWQMVLERRLEADGKFYYGVRTTGVYCRPSCPSRRPRRESVEFFTDAAEAERAGYRACLRCRPGDADAQTQAVARARQLLDERAADGPLTLKELARVAGMSPFHLQRVFKRRIGVSPHEYQRARRMEAFRHEARRQPTVTGALYEAGFGSSSRLYEHATERLGMTPGEYRHGGSGVTICYDRFRSPLGDVLIAATDRGLCSLRLGDSGDALEVELRQEFPNAALEPDPERLAPYRLALINWMEGDPGELDLPLDLKASAFQLRVWKLLREIPRGETRSYQQLAEAAGSPRAVRAVGSACARNPVAVVIPCHRAVRKNGDLAGYRWGLERKRELLDLERK